MRSAPSYLMAFLLFAFGCQDHEKVTDFKKMEWLLGTWKSETPGQLFYEDWTRDSDTEFSNLNFVVCNGDTSISGRSKIEIVHRKIVYASGGMYWEMISLQDQQIVFENKQREEKFTFSLNEKKEWIALLQYPTSRVEYTLTKTVPIPDLLKNKSAPLEGHYEGYFEFNHKKLNTTLDISFENGKQAAFISNPEILVYHDPVSDFCYNPPEITFKKYEGGQQITFTGTVIDDRIEGQLSGEIPAKFYFSKDNAYDPGQKNYYIEDIIITNGNTNLAATLYLPITVYPTAAMVMLSGSGRHTKEEFYGFADFFASQGIAILVYDKRDVSDKAYPNLKLTSNQGSDIVLLQDLVDDAAAAVTYLKSNSEINPNKIGLWGISQGGIVASMLIAQHPEMAFVIAVSTPTTTLKECFHFQKLIQVKRQVKDSLTLQKIENLWNEFNNSIINGNDLAKLKPMIDKAYAEGWGEASQISQSLPTADDLKYNFGYNALGLDPSLYWAKVNIPTYAVYGQSDIQVPVQRSTEVIKQVFKHKQNLLTIKTYPNADHLIKTIQDRDNFDFPKYAPGYLSDMLDWVIAVTQNR